MPYPSRSQKSSPARENLGGWAAAWGREKSSDDLPDQQTIVLGTTNYAALKPMNTDKKEESTPKPMEKKIETTTNMFRAKSNDNNPFAGSATAIFGSSTTNSTGIFGGAKPTTMFGATNNTSIFGSSSSAIPTRALKPAEVPLPDIDSDDSF